LQRSDITYWY